MRSNYARLRNDNEYYKHSWNAIDNFLGEILNE